VIRNEVCICKTSSNEFNIQNGIKKEMLYRHCFSTLLHNKPQEGPKKSGIGTEWDKPAPDL
jgi:hypothetical protein